MTCYTQCEKLTCSGLQHMYGNLAGCIPHALAQTLAAACAGFTSKQAFKMGIPAIGIVAVLVANVTFIAYATPPGTSPICFSPMLLIQLYD